MGNKIELGQGLGMENLDAEEGVHVVLCRNVTVYLAELGNPFGETLT